MQKINRYMSDNTFAKIKNKSDRVGWVEARNPTATVILLMRMVDPENKSGAFESFAYKQLLFEPIVGGGLFTAAAPALIHQFGPIQVLVLTAVILIAWLVFGFWNFKQTMRV